MPKRTRSTKKTKENKEVKVNLPTLHPSQESLATRMHDVDRDQQAPILDAPPGKGKTRVMSHYLDKVDEDGVTRLTVIVCADVNAARKQALEFGSLSNAYQKNTHARRVEALLEEDKPVRVVMSPPMFYKLVFGEPAEDGERHEPLKYFANDFLPNVIGGTCQEINFVFDEIHTIQKKPGIDDAFDKLRAYAATKDLTVYCCGLTATPEAQLPSEKLMGKPAVLIEYAEKELQAFNADLCKQPVVPDWTVVELPVPDKAHHQVDMYHLKTVLLGGMLVTQADLKADEKALGLHWAKLDGKPSTGTKLPFVQNLATALMDGQTEFTQEEFDAFQLTLRADSYVHFVVESTPKKKGSPKKKQKAHYYFKPLTLGIGTTTSTCIERLLSKILAEQSHGDTGGAVFAQLELNGRSMQRMVEGTLAEPENMHDCVLIAHAKPSGAQFAFECLKEVQELEGVREFEYHDLRFHGDMKAQDTAISHFKSAFQQQASGPSLGVINPSQMKATNDFGHNVSAAICVGPTEWMTAAKRKQLQGRLGRPGVLEDGSIVPKAFKMVWLKSPWASKILGIHKKKSLVMTDAVNALWGQSGTQSGKGTRELERIEATMRKLLKVDELQLFADSMTEEYLAMELDPTKKAQHLLKYKEICHKVISYYVYDEQKTADE